MNAVSRSSKKRCGNEKVNANEKDLTHRKQNHNRANHQKLFSRTTSNTISDELCFGEYLDSTTTSYQTDKGGKLEEPLPAIAMVLGDFLAPTLSRAMLEYWKP
ncbi:uncharacterized protein LOC119562540 [Drosophila subpulchrella]|uniref:uncharacterized protein LOC119562540 n=1 Tax=Drosophila subpulchrella TaxID=1486046 RepID=UPI0018A15A83|nr:uncharacterized protein LOC119562540 [Drosophila subpulchrella]